MTSKLTDYSQNYIQECFHIWYSLGRPDFHAYRDKFPKDEFGRTASVTVLRKWRNKYQWDIVANDMDDKAIAIVQTEMIQQKADMLRRQAKIGYELQRLGMNYLISGTFDTSASAVSAIIKGAELERSSLGISDLILRMSKMSDQELQDEIMKQINRASESGQIIEAEEIKGDENES